MTAFATRLNSAPTGDIRVTHYTAHGLNPHATGLLGIVQMRATPEGAEVLWVVQSPFAYSGASDGPRAQALALEVSKPGVGTEWVQRRLELTNTRLAVRQGAIRLLEEEEVQELFRAVENHDSGRQLQEPESIESLNRLWPQVKALIAADVEQGLFDGDSPIFDMDEATHARAFSLSEPTNLNRFRVHQLEDSLEVRVEDTVVTVPFTGYAGFKVWTQVRRTFSTSERSTLAKLAIGIAIDSDPVLAGRLDGVAIRADNLAWQTESPAKIVTSGEGREIASIQTGVAVGDSFERWIIQREPALAVAIRTDGEGYAKTKTGVMITDPGLAFKGTAVQLTPGQIESVLREAVESADAAKFSDLDIIQFWAATKDGIRSMAATGQVLPPERGDLNVTSVLPLDSPLL